MLLVLLGLYVALVLVVIMGSTAYVGCCILDACVCCLASSWVLVYFRLFVVWCWFVGVFPLDVFDWCCCLISGWICWFWLYLLVGFLCGFNRRFWASFGRFVVECCCCSLFLGVGFYICFTFWLLCFSLVFCFGFVLFNNAVFRFFLLLLTISSIVLLFFVVLVNLICLYVYTLLECGVLLCLLWLFDY